MTTIRSVALLLSVAFAALVASVTPAYAATDTEAADVAYENQHYGEALALYEAAAAKGDLRSQEIAGLMCLYGEAMYGPEIRRDKLRAAKWLRLAAEQGSEMARRLLPRVELAAAQ
jgi:TPR repeat protein